MTDDLERTDHASSAVNSALATIAPTRAELLALHRAARARRNAAALGSEAYREAADDISRIETAISGLTPVDPLPEV